jgi:hypothetical protein
MSLVEPSEIATNFAPQAPRDWARLISKLRWIGLDEEAKWLEMAVRTLPGEQRYGISSGPFDTD